MCLRDYIFRSYHFLAKVTFEHFNFPFLCLTLNSAIYNIALPSKHSFNATLKCLYFRHDLAEFCRFFRRFNFLTFFSCFYRFQKCIAFVFSVFWIVLIFSTVIFIPAFIWLIYLSLPNLYFYAIRSMAMFWMLTQT